MRSPMRAAGGCSGRSRTRANEYRLTALIDGERRKLVIDRAFADDQGRRWIVDYKTSGHEGADVGGVPRPERERYRAQLERYACALGDGDRSGSTFRCSPAGAKAELGTGARVPQCLRAVRETLAEHRLKPASSADKFGIRERRWT